MFPGYFSFNEINFSAAESLPFVLNSVGTFENQIPVNKPYGIVEHEFIWITKNSAHFEIDGVSFVLKTNEGVFIKKDIPHSYKDTGSDFNTSWFTFSIDERFLNYICPERWFKFIVPPFLETEAEAMYKFSTGESNILTRSALGYSEVINLFSAIRPHTEKKEIKIRQYLESHYNEPLTLDSIAAYMGMDRFSLSHYWSKTHDISIMNELFSIRIEKSKIFLRMDNVSIETIGKMCGFESHSYFTKRFRERCNESPREYRKRIKLQKL